MAHNISNVIDNRKTVIFSSQRIEIPEIDEESANIYEDKISNISTNEIPKTPTLPINSLMPYRTNVLFTSRERELIALAQNIKTKNLTTVISGIGGIGKTQLAVEFAYLYGYVFSGGVYLIDASDHQSAINDISKCIGCIPPDIHLIFKELSLDDKVDLVRKSWLSRIPRLLIFDNVEDENILDNILPSSGGCRIIITSRRALWNITRNIFLMSLSILSRADSIDLLCKYRNDLSEDINILDSIAEELGDLPLAIRLAGSYLSFYQYSVSAQEYLNDIRLQSINHLSMRAPSKYTPANEKGINSIFDISFNKLNSKDRDDRISILIMKHMAYVKPDLFIDRLFIQSSVLLEVNKYYYFIFSIIPKLHSVLKPKINIDFESSINKLINIGFLEINEEGHIKVHSLISDYIRFFLKKKSPIKFIRSSIFSYIYIFPK